MDRTTVIQYTQDQNRGEWKVVRIQFDDLAVFDRTEDVILSDPAFHHPSQGVQPSFEIPLPNGMPDAFENVLHIKTRFVPDFVTVVLGRRHVQCMTSR